jgi:ABC-2 type transport system ATP-binding protein
MPAAEYPDGAVIDVRSLSKRFGPIIALDSIDINIAQRGIVGFLGPNGAGKTTTMRILTGYLAATSGTAVVCGHDVFDDPIAVKARVGYLPETPPLYPDLTVGEYLSFVAEIRGVEPGRVSVTVGAAMERVGLRGWERRLTGALSKGYRQRVGLAQALLHDPPLLVLDEPTSGLDPAQLPGIRRLIQDLARERLVLLSTHVLPEVEQLCERVVLIHRGRIAGDGTVEELAARTGRGAWTEVWVEGDPPAASGRIAEVPSVARVEALGGGRYRVEGAPGAPADVVASCVAAGWRVPVAAPRVATLEDVFLALVGGEA